MNSTLDRYEFRFDCWAFYDRLTDNGLECQILPEVDPMPDGWTRRTVEGGWCARTKGSDEWSGVWISRDSAQRSILAAFDSCREW